MEAYLDAIEDIPPNFPSPKGNLAMLTCFVDADHAKDKVSRGQSRELCYL